MHSLLRAAAGTGARSARWEYLCLALGSDRAARAFVVSAIERLEPQQAQIAREFDFGRRTAKVIATELGISLTRFYRERRVALERLEAIVERELGEATGIRSTGGLSLAEMELAAADLTDRSGYPARAIEQLRNLLKRAPAERYRVVALTRLAVLYSKRGNAELAQRTLLDARRQSGAAPADAIDLEFAEAMLAADSVDEPRVRDALRRLTSQAKPPTEPSRLEATARVMTELAAMHIARSDMQAARQTLERVDTVLAAHPLPPLDVRTRLLNLRAQMHIATPASIGIARVEARTAFHMASRHGLAREAWVALHTLVDNHLGILDLPSVLAYAHYLEDAAQRIGESRQIAMASLILAATQAQMGAIDSALQRIDACRTLSAGPSDVERDLLEAYVLGLSGKYVAALEAARRAKYLAESLGLINLIGVGLLYESSLLEDSGTSGGVREAAAAAANVLETGTSPYHLAKAYNRLYSLTGEGRFRDRARTLTATFRRESGFLEKLHSGDSARDRTFGGMLTRRQSEIAELICAGKTNKQIAAATGISESTAAHHVEAILRRLDLRARWQLLERYAM
jgi:DNA-binding CsgD family transcriptional regulator